MQPIPHPEIEQLRQRYRELQDALRQTLQEYFFLRTELYPSLLAEYERHFRTLELQLQNVSLRAAQLRRRVELLLVKLQRGEPITERTFALVEQIVAREFAALWERLHAPEQPHRTQSPAAEAEEFPKLYRLLVKRLHPDAAGAETEEFRRYWTAVQRAYRERNIHHLRQLYFLLCSEMLDAEPESEPASLEYLRRRISQLERRLTVERRRLEQLRAEEPFCLPLSDPEWLAQRRRELEREIQQREQEIATYTDLLARIRSQNLTPQSAENSELLERIREQTYGRR